MKRLYRMDRVLPSLLLCGGLAASAGCEAERPPRQSGEAIPNVYLERLQEAEAVKHSIEQRNLEQQRIDDLIGRGQAPAPER